VIRNIIEIFRLELMLQLGLATLLGGAIASSGSSAANRRVCAPTF
jgi:hypothetical protein